MTEPQSSTEGLHRTTFGAGIKRKRVEFVPPESPSQDDRREKVPNPSLGDLYLSITVKEDHHPSASLANSADASNASENYDEQTRDEAKMMDLCQICKLPIPSTGTESVTMSQSHELSLAHQVCAEHSYPPSHLDRGRQGLKYLSSYGWDPDSRLGLGALGTGIRNPIKAKAKHDTIGLGVELPDDKRKVEKMVKKLGAKGVRELDAKNKKQREKLQQQFYGNDDVEKYLGTDR